MSGTTPLKAKPLRNPGQGLDDKIQSIIDDKLISYCLVPAFFWVIAGLEYFAELRHMPRSPGLYAIFAACLSLYGAVRFFQIRKQIRALRLGRDGERAVGQYLDGLRETGARIFHDIPGEGFNVDHVVVSTKGIFVIETKTLTKPSKNSRVTFENSRLLVAGRKLDRDPISQAQSAARWLQRLLNDSTGKRFEVWPVVVFPGWFVEPMPALMKRELWVLEPKALPAFIEHAEQSIEQPDVALAAYHLGQYIRGKNF